MSAPLLKEVKRSHPIQPRLLAILALLTPLDAAPPPEMCAAGRDRAAAPHRQPADGGTTGRALHPAAGVLQALGSNTTWGSPYQTRNMLFIPGRQ